MKRGAGEVIEVEGKPAAVYRGLDGANPRPFSVCTHMVLRALQRAEHTWDCPCHGSRFKPNGTSWLDLLKTAAEIQIRDVVNRK